MIFYDNKKKNNLIVLLYPLFIMLLLMTSIFLRDRRLSKIQAAKTKDYKEALNLTNMQMYREAASLLKKHRGKFEKREALLYFNALVEEASFTEAIKIWKKDLAADDKAFKFIIDKMIEKGKYSKALKLLTDNEDMGDQDKLDAIYIDLLSNLREYKVKEIFHAGWYFDDLAIMEDERGYFLMDGLGNRLSGDVYDSLHVAEDGFYGKKNDKWLKLDKKGNFQKLIDQDPLDKKNRMGPNPSRLISPYEEAGGFGYKYKDSAITGAIYDFASPVNNCGLAFAFEGGSWYRLFFIALRKDSI